jgi:hypothetical protein
LQGGVRGGVLALFFPLTKAHIHKTRKWCTAIFLFHSVRCVFHFMFLGTRSQGHSSALNGKMISFTLKGG